MSYVCWSSSSDLAATQRQVESDEINFNAAISACEKCQRWQHLVQTTSDDIRRHLSSSFSVAFGPSGRMCQVVVAFVAPGTPARAVPGPLRFASLLLNTMIGSTIEPVDGSYDAVISACQKGLRILRFGYVWYFWCVWWLCTLHNSEAYPCSYHRTECPSGPCSESI
jgi:hypothetical protein